MSQVDIAINIELSLHRLSKTSYFAHPIAGRSEVQAWCQNKQFLSYVPNSRCLKTCQEKDSEKQLASQCINMVRQ